MKAIIHSKRSTKKRLEKELRKLFPKMAIYVRRNHGTIHPSAWGEYHVFENWQVWIGKNFWSKHRCNMEGYYMQSFDSKTIFEMVPEMYQKILSSKVLQ